MDRMKMVGRYNAVKGGRSMGLAFRREQQLHKAIEDIRMLGRMGQNICPVCAHYNHGEGCKDECPKCLKEDNFKWRGMQDE